MVTGERVHEAGPIRADHEMDVATVNAIKTFEVDNSTPANGKAAHPVARTKKGSLYRSPTLSGAQKRT